MITYGIDNHMARVVLLPESDDTGTSYQPALELMTPPRGANLAPAFYRLEGEPAMRRLARFLQEYFAEVDGQRAAVREALEHLEACGSEPSLCEACAHAEAVLMD